MIKVGDYIKHKDNGMIYKVVGSSEKLLHITDFKQTWQHIGVDVATNNYVVVDYKQLYEQQKQRADELEKRWSELVTFVKECDVVISKESKNYPFMNDYEQAIIQGKDNRIDNIIEKIEQLEKEDNNA